MEHCLHYLRFIVPPMSKSPLRTLLSSVALLGLLSACGSSNIGMNTDGTMDITTQEGTAKIGTQTMPENWPTDVPTYPNATVSYSTLVNSQTGKPGMAVALTTEDETQAVTDYYKKELSANGWTVDAAMVGAGTSIFSARKDNRTASFLIAGAEGQTTITMAVETGDEK